ncbi:hypothetical protein OAT92_06675 [Porticoccaceae bacterium]|nr:hypothetical protein [Porticoccaceae bacterium]
MNSFCNGKKVFITGHTGFKGTWLTQMMVRAGAEAVNFGSNFEISIGDTAQLIAEAMNVKIDVITDEARLRPADSEVERLWADNTKAKQLFGWQPAYGGLEGFKRGIAETAEWFEHSGNLRSYKADVYNV